METTKAKIKENEALKISFEMNEWEDFLLVLEEIRGRDRDMIKMYRKKWTDAYQQTTSQKQTIERLREMLKETTETLKAIRRHGLREEGGYETAVTLVGETIHEADTLLENLGKSTYENNVCERLYNALQTFKEGVDDGSIIFGSTRKPDDFAKTFMASVRELLNTTEPNQDGKH
ncbi:MAG: hypothetical protein NXH86_04275 [Flavobacteriaceae bacterium]|nr:hypothetical protein [Flavobacteriaceae bacterium]